MLRGGKSEVMEFKVEVDKDMYGISKCPYRTFEDIYLGGYFCWKMCKYHRGIDRENRIVKCDFPIEEFEGRVEIGKHGSLYELFEKIRDLANFKE
jgi:hypothetical protein